LTDGGNGQAAANPGKNKVLIQCLDTSGSMSGSPIEALKLGAKLIGDKYFDAEERPFEQFHTYLYNNECETLNFNDKASFNARISNIRAGGGTNFMSVFQKIEILLANNPNLEELTVMFITDGQDGYGRRNPGMNADDAYNQVKERIKARPGLKSRFLSVGFSRDHDAVFMNRIANFGTEQGNFIFIDSQE
jgi:uncharacterized protein with von Willebrand factor type A (vWA) domain